MLYAAGRVRVIVDRMRWSLEAAVCTALVLAMAACGTPPDEAEQDGGAGMDGSTADQCTRNSECEDSLFCTTWRCVPGSAGADDRGCIEVGPPCALGESCVEAESQCVTEACGSVTDADGDGHDSVACGGDDCDDDDANRYAGNPEVCDDAGHDEDCDATTVADAVDGDTDGDGETSRACCNGDACGTDCDDGDRAIHTGARDLCNARDDDCDTVIDEAGTEALCPGGTCIGGRCNLPAWDRVIGGTSSDVVWDVVMDERGYVYAGGFFEGEASFGAAGPPEAAIGAAGAFIAAYEPDGAYAWLRSFGGPGRDLVFRLAHAPGSDRLYAFIRVGSGGSVDLGGGPRPPGAYVVAFDMNGTYQWDREIPFIEDIDATPAGVIVAGFFGSEFDFGGGTRTPTRPTAYVVSYASDGAYRWDRLLEADASMRIREVTYDDGVIAVTGSFNGAADFGDGRTCPGSGSGTVGDDAFAASMTDAPTPTITSIYCTSGSGTSQGLHVALSGGRVHLCGFLLGTEDLGLGLVTSPSTGGDLGFLLTLDAAGAPEAQRTWFTSSSESACAALNTDTSGRVFVAGSMNGTADFGGGPRTVARTSAFFARYDADLSHRSDGILTGTETIEAFGADIGPADSTVIAGNLRGVADLGSGPRSSSGGIDGFIVRFAN